MVIVVVVVVRGVDVLHGVALVLVVVLAGSPFLVHLVCC